jgi:hypothetical protein
MAGNESTMFVEATTTFFTKETGDICLVFQVGHL